MQLEQLMQQRSKCIITIVILVGTLLAAVAPHFRLPPPAGLWVPAPYYFHHNDDHDHEIMLSEMEVAPPEAISGDGWDGIYTTVLYISDCTYSNWPRAPLERC